MILEDQKQFQIAEDLQEIAGKNLYTEEYRSCSEKAIDYICELNIPKEIPILDIASGKGYLAFQLLEKLPNHIIISDFSPQIIKKNKLRLEQKNLLNVSLLVFDARKTPFKSNSIEIMTTNLGLGNIQNPGGLLQEMKRILHGNFYPIMFFFNEDDIEHKKFIQDNNLSPLLFLEFTLESFKKQHFVIKTGFECSSFAKPTPQGEIIQAGIDSLPIKETILKWIVFQINY
jgi:ubiquinone/menaquinone biosynthesis C-methylase UbiE